VFIAAAVAAAVVLGGGALAYFLFLVPNDAGKAQAVSERPPVVYTLENGERETRFYAGDALSVPAGAGADADSYRVDVSAITDFVEIAAADKYMRLGLAEEAGIDLDGDGDAELSVAVLDFEPNRPDIGAELRFETAASAPADEDAPATATVAPGGVILSGASPYPFTVQVEFLLPCMFRWEVLREAGQRGRNERYFGRGEALNIEAQNGVRIWVSNSAAVRVQATGGGLSVPLETGTAGEVVVEDIHWVPASGGRNNLIQDHLN
jgi:hypothetical protein